jgi:hypothetical protein
MTIFFIGYGVARCGSGPETGSVGQISLAQAAVGQRYYAFFTEYLI